jgi:glutamate-5-semialdehyde dehydrogenase
MRIPLGVICVIYEARPNVTSDAAALALRSGNAIILKGGSDARNSNRAVGEAISAALDASGIPPGAVSVLADSPREQIGELLQLDSLIDLVIPRGGEGLIRYVCERSRIPVVKHYKGVCHLYVDKDADVDMAVRIAVNGKASRPSVCNSIETILVHESIADAVLGPLVDALSAAGVVIHGDARVCRVRDGIVPATEEDWSAEYLSLDVALRVVHDIDEAIAHIATWGSDHTEAIITKSIDAANRFTTEVMSSCVMVNASTRFADGGQLGLGAEIGISTSRVHAYGPMGAEGLTTTRFVVLGEGQVRE